MKPYFSAAIADVISSFVLCSIWATSSSRLSSRELRVSSVTDWLMISSASESCSSNFMARQRGEKRGSTEPSAFSASFSCDTAGSMVFPRFTCMCRTAAALSSYTSITVSKSRSIPRPVRPTVGTIGTPIIAARYSQSKLSPEFSSSSYMFNAITIGRFMSMSSVVRYRFLSRFEATTTLMITSGVLSLR